MKERERIVVGGLVVLMLLLWLGFLVHRSPRFAGSIWGGVLAVTGSMMMLVPLLYMLIKRSKRVKRLVTRYVSMRTILAWHIYAGVLGPILVLLHTGHKFESALGITLTAMTIIVVVSGFVGRYMMSRISQEIREKQDMLAELRARYELVRHDLQTRPEVRQQLLWLKHLVPRIAVQLFFVAGDTPRATLPGAAQAARLAESMADLEFAIRTHKMFKTAFRTWLRVHITISVLLYVLMGLHVWAAIHFGLRWFP